MTRHVRVRKAPDPLNIHLHPKQWLAFLSAAVEVLYGGAAGGGKSFLLRVAAIVWASSIPGLQVYLFRRISDDLVKNHLEGPKGFRSLLASWVLSGFCEIVEGEIRFWNGSKIYLCHCKDEKDIYKYQGAEIHVLLIDELTHFTEAMYRFLRNRVRMVGIVLPPEYAGRFPRILCAANPGNIGHLFVKNTFIVGCEPLKIRHMPPIEGGMLRQYIPARLEDNPDTLRDDPGYEGRLEGLGSRTLVAAMRRGDWDVVEGAFFSEWSNLHHVLTPFTLPSHWLRFRSADWGSASPYSIGWWAVVGDDFAVSTETMDSDIGQSRIGTVGGMGSARGRFLPRGALLRYREDYGKKGGKLTGGAVGKLIAKAEESDPKLTYGVLDPRAFAEDGGPSIAEGINDELLKKKLAAFHKADNARVSRAQSPDSGGPMGGWDQMRGRFVGTAKKDEHGTVDWSIGRPMIYCFSTCVDSIRTIPVLQHDPHRAEDLNTHSEDHCADEWRYACMSRPWIKSLAKDEAVRSDAYRGTSSDSKYGTTSDTATL